ncbi:hypothetical protein CYMTET_23326 [Cymbomonas tetramitiformis]|uniref:Uncharacterized protein n=1 Tax=Cymbomonas tetramitiformis TaxID=36881 RepID=A0AAE0L123_9CHLO|nr:hypothetical protein CYMTET_23326 [Cymbomonas tetramitiformis]
MSPPYVTSVAYCIEIGLGFARLDNAPSLSLVSKGRRCAVADSLKLELTIKSVLKISLIANGLPGVYLLHVRD